jgi:uncharacterized membrane protein
MNKEQETKAPEEPVSTSLASDVPGKDVAAHTLGSAISGASAGATIGSFVAGPMGAVLGSILGVLIGGALQVTSGKSQTLQPPKKCDEQVESGKGGEE